MAKVIDYSGRKIKHLTLLHYSRPGGPGVGSFWRARCDCGKIKEVIAKDVVAGRIGSCGECQYVQELKTLSRNKGRGMKREKRRQLGRLISACNKDGILFSLSPKEFEEILTQPCLFCQAPAVGVGRLELAEGFTRTNTLPHCRACQRMRRDLTILEFLGNVKKVHDGIILSMVRQEKDLTTS